MALIKTLSVSSVFSYKDTKLLLFVFLILPVSSLSEITPNIFLSFIVEDNLTIGILSFIVGLFDLSRL